MKAHSNRQPIVSAKMKFHFLLSCLIVIPMVKCSHHVIVIDAGSSGTRAHYYIFNDDPSAPYRQKFISETTLKTTPGLSSYKDDVPGAVKSVQDLVNKLLVQQGAAGDTSKDMLLEATAGMRLLKIVDRSKAENIMENVKSSLRSSFPQFNLCDECVVISDGVEEGLYMYVTVNALLGKNVRTTAPLSLTSVLEMGGSSTQIALFRHFTNDDSQPDIKPDLRKKFHGLIEDKPLFVKSYFPWGADTAEALLHGVDEKCLTSVCTNVPEVIKSPCFHPQFEGTVKNSATKITIKGDESVAAGERYVRCRAQIERPLRGSFEPIFFSLMQTIEPVYLVSAFYYVLSSELNRTGEIRISLPEMVNVASKACQRVVATGKHAPRNCFRMTYFNSLLTNGYEFSLMQQFIATDKINKVDLDWTYGAALRLLGPK